MDEVKLKKYPEGVTLNVLSMKVFDCLTRYTSFPWPILTAQCKRCQTDPVNLTIDGLERVLPFLVEGVARFTSPQKGELLRQELNSLLSKSRPK
jgi:hypothetical protein